MYLNNSTVRKKVGFETRVPKAAVQTTAAITLTVQRAQYRLLYHSALRKHAHAQQATITNLTTNFSPQEHHLCFRSSTAHGHTHRAFCRSYMQQKKSWANKPDMGCHRAVDAHIFSEQGPCAGWKNSVSSSNTAALPRLPPLPSLPAGIALGSPQAPHTCASAGPCECSWNAMWG